MLLHLLNTVREKWMREARYRWRKRKLAGRTGRHGKLSSGAKARSLLQICAGAEAPAS